MTPNELVHNTQPDYKDYFQSFFMDTFYNQNESNLKKSIPKFLNEIFEIGITYSKAE